MTTRAHLLDHDGCLIFPRWPSVCTVLPGAEVILTNIILSLYTSICSCGSSQLPDLTFIETIIMIANICPDSAVWTIKTKKNVLLYFVFTGEGDHSMGPSSNILLEFLICNSLVKMTK